MPGWKQHLQWSFVSIILLFVALHYYKLHSFNFNNAYYVILYLEMIGAGLLASLAPDFDIGNSQGNKIIMVAISTVGIMSLIYYITINQNIFLLAVPITIFSFIMIAELFTQHRGFFHSLRANFLVALPFFLLGYKLIALAVIVGFLSHLLADNEIKI